MDETALHDPQTDIAVVGIACRFPGAPDPETFGALVREQRLSVRDLSRAEMTADGVSPNALADSRYVARGAPLDAIDLFDADFFGLSPREAERMDPQHRLMLELAWEVLEAAGIPPASDRPIGVFAGCSNPNYLIFNVAASDRQWFGTPDYVETLIATDRDYLATRVSYKLGLIGPSLTVQTACSTSLVAVHLACQSLLLGECDVALAGGVALQVPHRTGYVWQPGGYSSRDGVCRPYAAEGDGTVFGSGGGLVALRRLEDALADRDAIVAIVKGTAIGNDGAARAGFSAPGVAGQSRVIGAALAAAGVPAAGIGYVEGHGTGTPLGDPIEVAALNRAFAAAGGARNVALGSVKGNLGHLDTAAGIAGLIKTALALQAGELPPSLHGETPNPAIDFASGPFFINTRRRTWPKGAPFAGVSSFGIGGTNAHAVMGPAPVRAAPEAEDGEPALLVLSARAPQALRALAARTADWLRDGGRAHRLADIAAAAALRRVRHPERLAVTGRDRAAIAAGLDAWCAGTTTPAATRVRHGLAQPHAAGPVWIFPGQGGQSPAMGRDFLGYPVFVETVDRIASVSGPVDGWDLAALLADPDAAAALERPGPALMAGFAMQAGLAALWRTLGLAPAAVVGQSLGEIAAAWVAGALTLEQAARVAAARAAALAAHHAPGLMAHVPVEGAQARALLEALAPGAIAAGTLWLAAENAPDASLIAGAHGPMHAVLEALAARGLDPRLVPNGGFASHGPAVVPAAEALRAALADLAPAAPTFVFHSTVAGRQGHMVLDAEYWADNLRQPVRFGPILAQLIAAGCDTFLDIAPRPTSAAAIDAAARAAGTTAQVLPSCERDGGRAVFLDSLARLHVAGFEPNWRAFHQNTPPAVALPTYPWQRRQYWIDRRPINGAAEPRRGASARETALARLTHRRFTSSLGDASRFWEGSFDPAADPIWRGHAFRGLVVFPAAAIIDLVLTAAATLPDPIAGLADLVFQDAISAATTSGITLQLALTPEPEGYAFRLSRGGAPGDGTQSWQLSASGRVLLGPRIAPQQGPAGHFDLEDIVEGAHFYDGLARRGLYYGQAFRLIERVAIYGDRLLAQAITAATDADAPIVPYAFPLLDASLQVFNVDANDEVSHFPTRIARILLHDTTETTPRLVEIEASRAADTPGRATILGTGGAPLLTLEGIETAPVHHDGGDAAWLHALDWRPLTCLPVVPARETECVWAVVGGEDGFADRICTLLAADGADALRIAAPQVDTSSETAWRKAFAPLGDGPCRLLDLRSLMGDGAAAQPAHLLNAACAAGLASVALLRTLTDRTAPTEFITVTRGATEAAPVANAPALTQAALWGLCRTIAVEYSELRPRLIDLDRNAGADDLLAAVEHLHEPEIAIRHGRLLVPRLGPSEAARGCEARLRSDGAWLVVGATGAIGLPVLCALVARGLRTIVIAARTPPSGRIASRLAALQAQGVALEFEPLDVTDAVAVADLVARIERSRGPIRGVVHMAGALRDRFAAGLHREDFAAVFAPKLVGAFALHEATRDCDLDAFVLFSSAAAVLGAPGQGAHAAANAALARLAAHRAGLGLPALVIDWGPWAEAGVENAYSAAHRTMGMDSMDHSRGVRLFDAALRAGRTRVGAFHFDPIRWQKRFPTLALSPILSEPQRRVRVAARLDGLDGLDSTVRTRTTARVVREELAAVLGLTSEDIETDRPFGEQNLSSMMALELRSRLEAELGLVIPTATLWRHPTVERLAVALAGDNS